MAAAARDDKLNMYVWDNVNHVQHQVQAQCSSHKHSTIYYPAACRLVQALRAYARSRGARMRASAARAALHLSGALRLNEILEHASPVLGFGLGNTGQAGDQGIATHGRGRGRSGARDAGR